MYYLLLPPTAFLLVAFGWWLRGWRDDRRADRMLRNINREIERREQTGKSALLFPTCLRCDRPFVLSELAARPVYCRACRATIKTERAKATPLTEAFCIVEDKRIELMREGKRPSSPEVRKLARVADYLDMLSEIEDAKWPEEVGG